jgi:hypothetical protein
VFGPADRVAAAHHIAVKAQAQVAARGFVGQRHMLTAGRALPVAKVDRDQAQGVEHVDLTQVGVGSFTNIFV